MITMEKITFLAGKEQYDEQYKFILDQSTEYQRLRYYQGSIYTFSYITKKETDTHIYWSESSKKPMFENDKLFFKHTNVQGASYEKRTKKIKIWFGKKFNSIGFEIQKDVLNTLVPWFDLVDIRYQHNNYITLITNEILNKMVKGSIECTEGIIQAFCKYSPYRKFNLDTKKLDFITNNSKIHFNLRNYKLIFLASKNPNDVVDYIYKNINSHFTMLTNLNETAMTALAIGKNIDVNWTNEELSKNKHDMNIKRVELNKIYDGMFGINNDVEDLPF